MTSAREFAKIGMTRYPEKDFSDDGARFKAYQYKGMILTYTTFDGEMYLSLRLDYEPDLSVYDYFHADWAAGYDDFNGVTMAEVAVTDIRAMLDRVADGLAEFRRQHANEAVNMSPYKAQCEAEMAAIENVLTEVRANCDWFTMSREKLNDVKRYTDELKHKIDALRNKMLAIDAMPAHLKRDALEKLSRYGYVDFSCERSYYVNSLRGMGLIK